VSTRGVIARQKGDVFEGRYHHWDSYPSGEGKALWELVHGTFNDNLSPQWPEDWKAVER
jgi:hypothetical protein